MFHTVKVRPGHAIITCLDEIGYNVPSNQCILDPREIPGAYNALRYDRLIQILNFKRFFLSFKIHREFILRT